MSIPTPRRPAPPPSTAFPFVASAAPVIGAVVMWAITQSPLALAFALLGPLFAVGGLVDARWRARRLTRKEAIRFNTELAAASAAVDDAHRRERERLHRRMASRPMWGSGDAVITLGTGTVRSELALEPSPPLGDTFDAPLEELARHASRLTDAPIVASASRGLDVTGASVSALAVARTWVLDLAQRLDPSTVSVRAPRTGWEWLARLPHRVALANHGPTVEFRGPDGDALASVTVAPPLAPLTAPIVVRVSADGAHLERHPEFDDRLEIRCRFTSESEAIVSADGLAQLALASGRRSTLTEPPDSVAFSALPVQSGMSCAIGLDGHRDPVIVDLVRHGPHAIVGGTTGSGKSELLTTWVAGLAEANTPDDVTFLLVDFKGGATFASVARLPHCVGLMTDLDARMAQRALDSLRAELRRRERALADLGARDISELPRGALARLVIVVDEYAALVDALPELAPLFADIAARGRSLGMHLVLCTQRPSGVVRDAVLANCTLRVSLRVLDPSDSTAVLGVPDAAHLPATPPGRAVAMIDGEHTLFQVAHCTADDVDAIIASTGETTPPSRPWVPPLPTSLATLPPAEEPGIPFALADLPHEQRHATAVWRPEQHGHMIVAGGSHAGVTNALHALVSASGGALAPSGVEGLWDTVVGALESVRSGAATPGVLALDDVDRAITRFSDDHRIAFIDALGALLAEGPAVGLRLVLGVSRLTGLPAQLTGACESRLVLRLADRHQHLDAGGESSLFDPEAPPGRGTWRGTLVQVVSAPHVEPASTAPTRAVADIARALAVVSTRAEEACRELSRAGFAITRLDPANRDALDVGGEGRSAIVGQPDQWQAAWSLMDAVRGRVPILFHRCTAADVRAILGSRVTPPPLSGSAAWLSDPDGVIRRVALT